MVYRPDCYVIGRVVSIASLVLFLSLIAIEFCVNRRYIRLRTGGILRTSFDLLMSDVPVPEDIDPFDDEMMGILPEEIAGKSEADAENAKEDSPEEQATGESNTEDEANG
jgi:hypothetical protein